MYIISTIVSTEFVLTAKTLVKVISLLAVATTLALTQWKRNSF